MTASLCGSAIAIAALLAPSTGEPEQLGYWPGFRGPGGSGIWGGKHAPTVWNGRTGEGVLWKKPVPLGGHSSPIVWGDRVFLTGADKKSRQVYCFDAKTGDLIWRREVALPDSAASPSVWEEGVLAAATPVADGERVCATFANGDIACFDFDGDLLWAKALGPLDDIYGHASSLALDEGKVLIQLDQGGGDDDLSQLLALDLTTGNQIWAADRPVGACWSSPIVIQSGRGKQIIACGDPLVIAHDPATGREIWRADLLGEDQAPTPVFADGVLYVARSGGYLTALRTDGAGDVTKTHLIWQVEEGTPEIASPVTDGKLLVVADAGAVCYDATTGQQLWRADMDETFVASPALAAGRLYLLSDEGVMVIAKAARRFELLGKCELGEECQASPAFAPGRIYIRGEKNLYCIGSVRK